MVSLTSQKDFRAVQGLSFCYLCGQDFIGGDTKNLDHIPPKNAFATRDREPLQLPTHYRCNHIHHQTDEKIGQMIGLRRGQVPLRKHWRLKVILNLSANLSFLTNLDIEEAVWRWVRGFHAALYHQSLPADDPSTGYRNGAMQTPFPRTFRTPRGGGLKPILPQHRLFVQTIKENRVKGNLDRIVSNKGKLVYECVWRQADASSEWLCIFALNICDWKDLGAVPGLPSCGCAGYYRLPSGEVPLNATKATNLAITIPNLEPLDPFGR